MKKKHSIVNWKEFLASRKNEFYVFFDKGRKKPIYEANDFKFQGTLGEGGFGRVYLVQHKKTRKEYALKVSNKAQLARRLTVNYAIGERKILEAINFQFCINSEFSFQDNSYLYIGLPFICGTDMFNLLQYRIYLEEKHAKFYCGQVVLAIEYLHNIDIIHRDIKPENILIDVNGYIKLADYGTSKIVKGRTYSMCGTEGFMAPEILLNMGHGKAVDWWCFGVLLFDVCAGRLPFTSPNTMRNAEKIILGIYCTPSYFSKLLTDLISNLLQVDLTKRYGNLRRGVNDIKEHPWFNELHWMKLLNQKLTAPFRPKLTGIDDILNLKFKQNKEIRLKVAKENMFGDLFINF
ncbi:cAMP-dependent protein kinase catalytic subunit alpha [Halyomorpha halys]|uniref:cAMP-dependent protein kinase catalytic subunit alpha n=1 Tax=Halyomorpha halys TaxID=286706 RepID=UPI0006D50318|nr:cAMP-dependent protein kinase catalytic subunit alpha [Halyomorpha halys]